MVGTLHRYRGSLSRQHYKRHAEERWQIGSCYALRWGSSFCEEDWSRPDSNGFRELTTPFILSPPVGERNSLPWRFSRMGEELKSTVESCLVGSPKVYHCGSFLCVNGFTYSSQTMRIPKKNTRLECDNRSFICLLPTVAKMILQHIKCSRSFVSENTPTRCCWRPLKMWPKWTNHLDYAHDIHLLSYRLMDLDLVTLDLGKEKVNIIKAKVLMSHVQFH